MTGGSFVANEKTVMIKEGCLKSTVTVNHITTKGALYGTDLHKMRRLSHSRPCVIGQQRISYREIWSVAPCLLKRTPPILYTDLIVTEKLFSHLEEIDTACRERLEIIENAMMQQEGVTEALKAADQMAWVRSMNSIHNRAEEVVLAELVYC